VKNELIKFAPLFAGLTDSERELLAAGFAEGQCPAQTELLKAGERSDAVYLIGQGFVALTTPNGTNLATLGPGSLLGDTSLLRNTPQDVTARALSEVGYWKLTDRTLRETILRQPSIGLKLGRNLGGMLTQMEDYLVQRLGAAAELQGLSPHTLGAAARRLQPREVKAQETIFRAGDTPQGLYLVENGAVELRSEVDTNVKALAPGALFGSLALLTGKPYGETAVVTQEGLLWVLAAEDFAALSAQQPGFRRSLARNSRTRLSPTDQRQAVLRLGQMPIFEDVAPQIMQAIAQRMVLQHVPAGERVYMVGEVGDALYLVDSGEVELTAENASGVLEEVGRISAGAFFGETSLVTGQIRSEDATAIRNTNLWILYKSDLNTLSAQHPEIGKALSQGLATRLTGTERGDEERFRAFQLLSGLSSLELRQVVDFLRPMRYRAGETIYRASSPADMLYLLEKGQVRMHGLSGGVWLLGAGEAFGERALLTNQPHNASATAETDVDVWTLSKQDFDMLLNRYPTLAISMSRILSERLSQTPAAGEPAFGYAQGQGDGAFDPEDLSSYAPINSAMTGNVPSRRRQQAASQPEGPPSRERFNLVEWFSNLSTLGKVQLAVLLLLVIWLIGIAAPAALLSLIQGTSVARGESASARSSLLNAINEVYAVGSYELASKDKDLAQALAMADQAVPPTPTYTPPPTLTAVPTATPLPTATPTPRPTATTPPTPAPFIQQFIPPTATPEAVAQAASVAPRAWDGRLDRLGVFVEDAQVAPGQPYWRLIEARWADEQEAGGKHHIYVEVLDETGKRVVGNPVTVWWGDGNFTAGIEDKAYPDYGFNYMMYAAGNAYDVKVEGLPSDIVHGAGMGDIERPRYGIHTAFYLVYQRAIK
jgi:CRP-like cAMP-binding protein